MIVTITMNPAIDKSTSVEALLPEKKMRCDSVVFEAGGGGVNISKAIKKLGGESLCIFPAGGANGRLLEEFLTELEISYKSVSIKDQTRESFTVNEHKTHAQYRFVLPGPTLSAEETNACLEIIEQLDPTPEFIIASGSLPPGVPDDFFSRLAAISKALDAKCIIDTSGTPLKRAADEGVYLLKPNLGELCSLANTTHLELHEIDDAAMSIVRKGNCEAMVVSLGPSGALLVTQDGYEHIPAPTVKKNTTVGAGDSMVAGMVYKLAQKRPLLEVARFGVACGTAATMTSGTQLFNVEDVHRLYNWIESYSEEHRLNFDDKQ
jgi:6-phosphofructokinase 2